MTIWTLLGRVIALGAVFGALCGFAFLIGLWIRKQEAAFSDYCRYCGESLTVTAVQDGTGKRFCSVAHRTLATLKKAAKP